MTPLVSLVRPCTCITTLCLQGAVDEIIALLKLQNAQSTVVGNDLLRGVSGGEKVRGSLCSSTRCLLFHSFSDGVGLARHFSRAPSHILTR